MKRGRDRAEGRLVTPAPCGVTIAVDARDSPDPHNQVPPSCGWLGVVVSLDQADAS